MSTTISGRDGASVTRRTRIASAMEFPSSGGTIRPMRGWQNHG